MIELRETNHADGTRARVTGLLTATVDIGLIVQEGQPYYRVRTSRKSNGSVRYRLFANYVQATEYALDYANRVAKQKSERQAREKQNDA